VEELQAAQQRQAEQHGGLDHPLDQQQLHARDGVVGGPLVAVQADALGEDLGHGAAMAQHVPDLAPREPESDQQVAEQAGDEQQGKHIRPAICENQVFYRGLYMAVNDQRLIWVDMEMTGLDPEKERIIEIAMVVTEPDLTPVA